MSSPKGFVGWDLWCFSEGKMRSPKYSLLETQNMEGHFQVGVSQNGLKGDVILKGIRNFYNFISRA